MHNKLIVADNRIAILGGRNLGDEYFGLNSSFNFLDIDVLGVGPVARESSELFDHFWNNPAVVSASAFGHDQPEESPARNSVCRSCAIKKIRAFTTCADRKAKLG